MTMKCEIDFVDNPTKVISKNQDIFGIAKLILTKEVTIRGFHIKTFAHVKVRWTEGEGKEQKVYTETEDREIGHSTYYKDGLFSFFEIFFPFIISDFCDFHFEFLTLQKSRQ